MIQNIERTLETQQQMNNPIIKWTKDHKRHFTKEDTQMENKHKKRCSSTYVITEIEIKTIIRQHYKTIRMANRTLTLLMSYLCYLYIKLITFHDWKYFNNFTDHIWDINKLMHMWETVTLEKYISSVMTNCLWPHGL